MSSLFAIFISVLGSMLARLRSLAIFLVSAITLIPHNLARLLTIFLPLLSGSSGFTAHALRGAVLTSKISIFVVPAAILLFIGLAAVTNPYLDPELDYAHKRSSAVEILDAEGHWLGIIPPPSFPDWSDGSILPPDHAAVPPTEIPPVWLSCLVFLEDREFDRLSRWLGVNPLAMLRSGWQTLLGDRRRGASTLYMQVVRTLHGRSPGQHEAPGEVLLRKTAELFGANALVKMLDDGDPRAAARFVGMHLPLVIGAPNSKFGEPLHGIELAARILFDAPAHALAPEKQAILAAAVKAPILMAPRGDPEVQAGVQARWQRAKDRADYCFRNMFPGRPTEITAARHRLAALELPEPAIDPSLRELLPKDPQAAWRIVVNPTRRALFFARHELSVLMPELNQIAGKEWRGRVVSIKLTTSATEGRPFASAVTTTLERLQLTVPGLAWNLTSTQIGGDVPDVVVACADPKGRLRRIYSTRHGLFWRRKAPTGSVAKMVAAVALSRYDRPETPYCLAPFPGMASSQGDVNACRNKESWIPAQEAFARSSSKAIHWALRNHANHDVLEKISAAFGLPTFADTPPATALTIGTFELTPAEMLRLASAVGTGLAGANDNVPMPRLIEAITMLNDQGQAVTTTGGTDQTVIAADLRQVFTRRVRSFVAAVLSETSGENGTLRSLHGLREQLDGQLYAKTGTVSIAGQTRNLHIVGTYLLGGKPWSFVVTFGVSSAARPLGSGVEAGQFAALAEVAVCEDVARSSSKGFAKRTSSR